MLLGVSSSSSLHFSVCSEPFMCSLNLITGEKLFCSICAHGEFLFPFKCKNNLLKHGCATEQ